MERIYKEKQHIDVIKDIDKAKGIVVIGINAFDIEDADGDTSLQVSFNRTAKNNLKQIRHFIDHSRTAIHTGVPQEFLISKVDIAAVSSLNMAVQQTKDLFATYLHAAENGTSVEHSIGAEAIQYTRTEKGGLMVSEW